MTANAFFALSNQKSNENNNNRDLGQLTSILFNNFPGFFTIQKLYIMGVGSMTGEIRMFAGDFAPKGWEICRGQEMPINFYQALYSVIGNNFGGDGRRVFRLPDMRGRLAVHPNDKLQLGRTGGSNTVLLEEKHVPPHTHEVISSKVKCSSVNTPAASRQSIPKDCYPGNTGSDFSYASAKFSGTTGTTKYFNANAVTGNTSNSGLAEPMENRMPSLCINFIICMQGDFPTRP